MAPLLDQEGDVGVRHDHPAEVEGLEAVEGLGDLADPGGGVPAPVLGYEVEHGRPGLALELEGLEAGEAPPEPGGTGGVADGDGDVLAGDGVDVVPLLAHQRDGLPVAGVVDVPHDQIERHIRYPAAHRPTQAPPLQLRSEARLLGFPRKS